MDSTTLHTKAHFTMGCCKTQKIVMGGIENSENQYGIE